MEHFNVRERVAVFIDGAHTYGSAKSLDFEMDFARVLEYFKTEYRLARAFYYTAIREDEEFNSIRPLIDWLAYNGYRVVTKPFKEFTDPVGRKKVKANLDVEMTVDMMEMAASVDHIVLLTGDGDMRRAVEAVQRMGARVTVISPLSGAADDLRRQADAFVDLAKFKDKFQRVERNADNRGVVATASRSAPQRSAVGLNR